MIVGVLEIRLRAVWVESLKQKRMIVKSLIAKIRNKFNVSAAEVSDNDNHKIIVIGIAYISNEIVQIDSALDNIINFIENNTEAEILNIDRNTF